MLSCSSICIKRKENNDFIDFFSFGRTSSNVNILIGQNQKPAKKSFLIICGYRDRVKECQTYLFHIVYLRVLFRKSM